MNEFDKMIAEQAAKEIKQFGKVLEDPNQRKKRGKGERPMNYEQLRLNQLKDTEEKARSDREVALTNKKRQAFDNFKKNATDEDKDKLRAKAHEIIAFNEKTFSKGTSYSLSQNSAYITSQIRLNWCEGISVPYEMIYKKYNP